MTKAKQRLLEHEPLTVPIRTAAIMLGIGRSTLYELLDAGEIETIKVGRRRLVLVAGQGVRRIKAPPTGKIDGQIPNLHHDHDVALLPGAALSVGMMRSRRKSCIQIGSAGRPAFRSFTIAVPYFG
jgi:excisionase family DNA binding protein